MYSPDLISRLEFESNSAALRGDVVVARALNNAARSMLYSNKLHSSPLNARAAWRCAPIVPSFTSNNLEF